MKPLLVREQNILNNSLNFDKTEHKYFHFPLHYHPEYELTLILQSYGQRRIGDSIENFSEGDLVFVGKNLPHVWKNDDVFLTKGNDLRAQAIAIKFLPEFAGHGLTERPEMAQVKEMLEKKAPQGVKLLGNLKSQVSQLMLRMPTMDDSDKFISLLQILNLMGKSKEYRLLASINYRDKNIKDSHRISGILDYIMDNYQEDLTLEKIASLINMNKNAFCRFFKKGTRKSLFTVINEVRIAKACQYLIEGDMNILQICFVCGYKNISNFNKAFKKIQGMAPTKYRKSHKG